MYHAVGDFLEELFEVEGSAVGAVIDLLDESEDQLVLGVEAEGARSHQQVPHIGSPLPRVGVEREQCVQLGDVLRREHWVLGGDVLAQHGLQLLILDLSL